MRDFNMEQPCTKEELVQAKSRRSCKDIKMDVEFFYRENIKPNLQANAELKLNICNRCSLKQYDSYAQDTGICDVCGQVEDVANPYIHDRITGKGYKIEEEWYGNAPRIYHYHRKIDEKRPSEINLFDLSVSGKDQIKIDDRSWFKKFVCPQKEYITYTGLRVVRVVTSRYLKYVDNSGSRHFAWLPKYVLIWDKNYKEGKFIWLRYYSKTSKKPEYLGLDGSQAPMNMNYVVSHRRRGVFG